MRRTMILAVLAAVLGQSSAQAQPVLVFDNLSNAENGVAGAGLSATGSTPNTFMGSAYNLTTGTTDITGFDIAPVNLSGTTFNALQLNIYVWGSVNSGTVSAATPAFSNQLAQYTLTSTGSFGSGFYFPYQTGSPGATPGITLAVPLVIPGTEIGLSFNYQGSTDGGVTYASVNSLTSPITYGTPATVGSNVFNGYYRNAGTPTETDGNFTSTLRSIGQADQSLGVRVFGDVVPVPEPGSMALCGLVIAVIPAWRRRRKA